MEKVNIKEKLNSINDYWNPRIAGELNGQQIRLVKIKGEFEFHKHEDEDEMFLVIKGSINLDFKDKTVKLKEGEFLIVPRGVIHRPFAEEEAQLMIYTKASNINTGNIHNEKTIDSQKLERI